MVFNLIQGLHSDKTRRAFFAGKVGTDFSEKTLSKLGEKLKTLEIENLLSARKRIAPKRSLGQTAAGRPKFAFSEWTRDGKLRHPRYLGLREDKRAKEVVRELPGKG